MSLVKRKIEAAQLFNCKNLTPFIDSIIEVLPFKGVSMSRFYSCEFEGVQFLTKLCFYRKSTPEIYNRASSKTIPQVDAEIQILNKFRENIIEKGISPCILELVYHKICPVAKLVHKPQCEDLLMSEYKGTPANDVNYLMCTFWDLVENDMAHNKCAFLVMERCDMSFDDFIRKHVGTPIGVAIFKSLLFQLVYTIYAISRVYKKFRHYDLHTENVMLKFDTSFTFKANEQKYLVFHVDDQVYTVPYFGIIVKIIDFGFSILPEEGILSNNIDDKSIMYNRIDNDLLVFFHYIHHVINRSASDKTGAIEKMLAVLDPNLSYITYYPEGIRKLGDKVPTYKQMIDSKIWSEYRKNKTIPQQIFGEYGIELSKF